MLKGFDAPVRAWEITGESARAGRFNVHATAPAYDGVASAAVTPLVGRDQELALLQDYWEQVTGGPRARGPVDWRRRHRQVPAGADLAVSARAADAFIDRVPLLALSRQQSPLSGRCLAAGHARLESRRFHRLQALQAATILRDSQASSGRAPSTYFLALHPNPRARASSADERRAPEATNVADAARCDPLVCCRASRAPHCRGLELAGSDDHGAVCAAHGPGADHSPARAFYRSRPVPGVLVSARACHTRDVDAPHAKPGRADGEPDAGSGASQPCGREGDRRQNRRRTAFHSRS